MSNLEDLHLTDYRHCNSVNRFLPNFIYALLISISHPIPNMGFVRRAHTRIATEMAAACTFAFIYTIAGVTTYIVHRSMEGAQWLSGRVFDSRPRGRGFQPHRGQRVVVLEQDIFILA